MSKQVGTSNNKHESIVKRTGQGGKVKTSTLNKHEKRSYKKYRGQGK